MNFIASNAKLAIFFLSGSGDVGGERIAGKKTEVVGGKVGDLCGTVIVGTLGTRGEPGGDVITAVVVVVVGRTIFTPGGGWCIVLKVQPCFFSGD